MHIPTLNVDVYNLRSISCLQIMMECNFSLFITIWTIIMCVQGLHILHCKLQFNCPILLKSTTIQLHWNL